MPSFKPWSRDELLVALNIYEKLPFGRLHAGNPLIRMAAKGLGRSANSLAMKLVNLASLDPMITRTGRTGLPGASRLDRAIWEEYAANRETLVPESEALFAGLGMSGVSPANADLLALRSDSASTARKTEVTIRLGQSYFRQAVLANFNGRCGVTGLPVPDLLRASHIIPWSVAEARRLDPTNGLALNALHDAAFDRGLISFDEDLRMVVGRGLKDVYSASVVADMFGRHEGESLRLDLHEARRPCSVALEYHRVNVFKN